jgi:photosystem II stability/assembly factor-like uncharacterized protein
LRLVLLACVVGLVAPGASSQPIVDREADEADLNRRRSEWMERIHRTAPGVDWRALESANRLEAQFLRRSFPWPRGVSPWQEKGASNLSGRNWVSALAADHSTLYVGSANGGLFRRAIAGAGAWTPITDDVGYGVHHLAYVPGEPERILIGSHDGRMFVSPDGGTTWDLPGGLPGWMGAIWRIVQEADQPATIYALVDGSIWNGSAWDHRNHLLRSEDGGETFARVHSEPLATRPDVWIDRTGPGPLYLVAGNQLKRSTDHGQTFTPVGTLPLNGTAAKLAGSEAGAPHFYCAVFGDTGWSLYSSSDGGTGWVFRTTLEDFYGTLFAPVTDANQVLYGGVNCHRSTDAGASFSLVNEWWEYYGDPDTKLHADIFGFNSHFVAIGKRSDETIFIHTDGGTYTLAPSATVPHNLTRFGFPNAQYYGTLTPLTDPNIIFAGSQDQGYQISHPGLGTVTPEFTQVISGDYAHLTSAWPDRSRMVFSVYPGFVLVQTGPGDLSNLELTNFPTGAPGFQFLPAITADPDDTARAYVGARQIWQVRRTGASVYDWSALPFDFDAGIGDVVGAIAIAPTDHNQWYVATYAGYLYRSTNHGVSWVRSVSVGPPSHYFSGSDVVVSATDPHLAYACGSGYSTPGVFKTTDGGVAWVPMGDGLPPTQVFALAFGSDPSSLYAATQAGPFRFNPGTNAWVNLLTATCCPPLTDYWDVESVPASGVIRFSTYGRGIWDYDPDLIISVPETAGAPSLAAELGPNPARAQSALEFTLPAAGQVEIAIYDVAGRQMVKLAEGWRGAGRHRVTFDLRSERGLELAAGLYLVRVVTPETTVVRRLTVLK